MSGQIAPRDPHINPGSQLSKCIDIEFHFWRIGGKRMSDKGSLRCQTPVYLSR